MDVTYYRKHEPFFGSWHIAKLIGQGNFGKVFEIERKEFGETYRAALKIITVPQNESEIKSVMASGMDQASVAEYFEGMAKEIVSEFKLMSTLKGNSCVVSYEDHQVITHEGGLGRDILIRMELLTPLIDYIQTNKMTRRDIIKLGIDMCNALVLCQKRNIIHRDIKPENIFVSEDGHFKLGDFGIARTIEKTSGGLSKKGTYTYMAPEVYKGEEYGSSVDIYSLGIVMYRLLNNNRTPFLPPLPEKIKHSDVDKALTLRIGGKIIPKPANADGRLAEIVLKACAYNSKERYSSPMEMRTELEAISYDSVEGEDIYPKGDEVAVEPNEYVATEDSVVPFEKLKSDDGTVSIFGDVKSKAKEEQKKLSQPEEVKEEIPEPKESEEPKDPEKPKPPEPGEDEGRRSTKYAIWGLVACIILVFILTLALRLSGGDEEDYIAEQPTETIIEEVFDDEVEEPVTEEPPLTIYEPEILEEEPEIEHQYITIRGVQYSTSLTELTLNSMNLTNEDIIPLRYMTNLVFLDLGGWEWGNTSPNRISDISPLSNLTNLRYLNLDYNLISDLSPISRLSNLRVLWLPRNEIDDLTPISGLTNLEELKLRNNPFSDLTPLSGLVNLRWLDLHIWEWQVRDLTPLSGLTNLIHLDLHRNQNNGLEPLSNLTNLEYLNLESTRIDDITALSSLTNLEHLQLSFTFVSNVEPLSGLTNLRYLGLSFTNVSDIRPLASLTNLELLLLAETEHLITDWSPVVHVPDVRGRPGNIPLD